MALRTGLIGGLVVIAGAVLAPAAEASTAPMCHNAEVFARPGLDRQLELYCPRTDAVTLATGPAHGTVSDLKMDGTRVRFRLRGDDGAPRTDALTLHLAGGGGEADQRVAITYTPRGENTAPTCEPVTVSERTDGSGPATLEFFVACADAEHDEMTIEGVGGPGRHLAGPKLQEGGANSSGNTWWSYRTAASSGEEQATYRATDGLGARGAEATINMRFGSAVDRLPTCRPNPWYWSGDGISPIRARPGLRRRFGVICEDEDADPIEPRLSLSPTRGKITGFEVGEPMHGFWGVQRWIDVTYVPTTAFEGRDEFAVIAGSQRGDGPTARMAIVATNAFNTSGGCGSSDAYSGGQPVDVAIGCTDDDGDALTARITAAPQHGTASPPVVTEGRYGVQDIRARYVPDEGFRGIDAITILVSDGHGAEHEYTLDIHVSDRYPAPQPNDPPPDAPNHHPAPTAEHGGSYSPPPTAPSPPPPRAAPVAPVGGPPMRRTGPARDGTFGEAPAIAPLDQARRILGTHSVRLLKTLGHARVYGASRAAAITCAVRCTVSATPAGSATASRVRRVTVEPGRAAVMRGLTGRVRLTITDALGKTRRATVSLTARR